MEILPTYSFHGSVTFLFSKAIQNYTTKQSDSYSFNHFSSKILACTCVFTQLLNRQLWSCVEKFLQTIKKKSFMLNLRCFRWSKAANCRQQRIENGSESSIVCKFSFYYFWYKFDMQKLSNGRILFIFKKKLL